MRWFTRKVFRMKHIVLVFIILLLVYVFRMLGMLNNLSDGTSLLEAKELNINHGPLWNTSTNSKKIDWHNYRQIKEDKERSGMGEHGRPAHLAESDQEKEQNLYSVNGFNGALSDNIALNRSVPDIRHPGCKDRMYLADLPTVSVIVPFHNEHWSTLLRTAYSVVNRSPPTLLKEIFLVDDASTKDFLKQELDDYVSRNIPKVQIVRLPKRSGLIAARLAGAKRASGEVLLFLDSHTEPNVNWLPPLLEPIAEDYRTAVCPFIDVIAYDTFQYRAQDEGARGAFDWELYYKRLPLLPQDIKKMPEPFVNPVMAGGLFAISAKFFWELGGYDDGLDIWGGEQYELSFKLWQCGGRMLDAPCSRVGHIYRKFAPFPNPGHGDFVGKNFRRVAEVWMDEYAEHLYLRRPHYRTLDAGNLTAQRALRERLHCKSFKWFLHNVAFDLLARYPPVEPGNFGSGKIRSVSHPKLCVDAQNGAQLSSLLIAPCVDPTIDHNEQNFVLSWHKDIRSSKRPMCWDLPDARPGSPVLLYGCHLGQGNQLWRYVPESKHIIHGTNDKCLDVNATSMKLFMSVCDERATQQWSVEQLDLKMISHWDQVRQQITGPLQYDEHD